jgi:hypothetical protein
LSALLLGLTGRKGSGKDTVAEILRREHGFHTLAFADPLKAAARDWYGLSREQTDGPLAVKEAVDERWGLSPREIMQRLGTEVGRSIHRETWTRYAMRRIDAAPGNWAITDCRFPNEASVIVFRGGFVVRIDRPGFGTGLHEGHASERGVDEIRPDAVLLNDGTLDTLATRVAALVRALRRSA